MRVRMRLIFGQKKISCKGLSGVPGAAEGGLQGCQVDGGMGIIGGSRRETIEPESADEALM